jgi:hypothetical protein
MGCDIHFYVEKKENGKWISADEWEKDTECGEPYLHVAYGKEFYDDRNYGLFAILAGVRNNYGFAGCDLGDKFNPISQPKGLPDDVCEEVKQASDYDGVDGHSHSWFTVQEILDFDWTQIVKMRGFVNAREYYRWASYKKDKGYAPESYCGGVSGRDVNIVSEKEMVELTDALKGEEQIKPLKYNEIVDKIKKELQHHYCQAEWTTTYYRCAGIFLSETIFRLLGLGKPEEVRMVFWFDN